jgi:putative SOS response-associated peptidase YedK
MGGILAGLEAKAAPSLKTSGEVLPANLAPIVAFEGGLAARAMIWGFSGYQAKARESGAKSSAKPRLLINARAEIAAELPAWRDSMAERRCLVPAAGFFEWERRPPRRKHPKIPVKFDHTGLVPKK